MMVEKIVKSLNAVNPFSKNIIKVSCYLSLFLGMIGMLLIGYNQFTVQKVDLYTLGSSMIYTGAVLFAQMIIGSLIIDFFGNFMQNHDD